MKEELARIHGHTDTIRRHTAELIAELDALPPLNNRRSRRRPISKRLPRNLAELTDNSVSIDIEYWHHATGSRELNYRVWLAAKGESYRGPTLEAARAKAVEAWEARQVTV